MEEQILNYIKHFHRGRQRAITYKELAKVLRINERELRNVIASLVTKGEPIGASQEGYFWITSNDEYQIARAEIISRIDKLRQRLNGLEKGWEARQVPQKSLF
jgi:hypothetical protein